jgi:hypothetical protein
MSVALPPPVHLVETFSRDDCDRIFLLFSRVMALRLNTSCWSGVPECALLGPTFSKAVDCAILVNSFYVIEIKLNYLAVAESWISVWTG